ncbi:terpene synthase family protein [Cryptosporangium japonicum]|uniref:Terpene synthase n=1 Tax=Cryptosporangium japonicum TaxID=80872 RepID=A0ABP3DDS9_9ACTN
MIDVPVLHVPFPALMNPHAAALGPQLQGWLLRSGLATPELSRQFERARFDLLVASLYPTAEPDELRTMAELVAWMFVYDDHFDVHRLGASPAKAAAAADRVSAVLAGAPASGPLMNALGELVRDRLSPAPAPLRQRLLGHLDDYCRSLVDELELRASGRIPAPDVYFDLRVNTFAWPVLADLAEFAVGTVLPAESRESRDFSALLATAGRLMILIQDLRSLDREIANGESHNVVLSLQDERQCNLPQAIELAHQLFADRLTEFLDRRDAVLATSDHRSRRAVAALEHLLSGHLAWYARTDRYDRADGLESLGGTDDLIFEGVDR